jgi:hypothetical protein
MRFLLTFLFLALFTPIMEAQDTALIQKQRIPDVSILDIKGNPFKTKQMSNEGRPFVIVLLSVRNSCFPKEMKMIFLK